MDFLNTFPPGVSASPNPVSVYVPITVAAPSHDIREAIAGGLFALAGVVIGALLTLLRDCIRDGKIAAAYRTRLIAALSHLGAMLDRALEISEVDNSTLALTMKRFMKDGFDPKLSSYVPKIAVDVIVCAQLCKITLPKLLELSASLPKDEEPLSAEYELKLRGFLVPTFRQVIEVLHSIDSEIASRAISPENTYWLRPINEINCLHNSKVNGDSASFHK